MMIDYQVKLIKFPNSKTKEAVVINPDDSYTIFIESTLCHEAQQKAFKHAMKHILSNDFLNTDVNIIETISHT